MVLPSHDEFSDVGESGAFEGLGENVCPIDMSRDLLDSDRPVGNLISEMVPLDGDVFGTGTILFTIHGKLEASSIVFVDGRLFDFADGRLVGLRGGCRSSCGEEISLTTEVEMTGKFEKKGSHG